MAVSAPSVSELPADALQALNSFVNEARARTRVPGVAVGIIHGDRGRLLYDEVAAWAFERFLGVEDVEPMPLELSVDELAPYVGRYELRMDTVELRLEDSGLVAQVFSKGGFPTADSPPHPPSPATRLAFFDRDRLIALDPPFTGGRAEFLRDQDGRIAWLRWGSRLAAPAQ